MSSPSPVLVSGVATLAVTSQPLPSGNAAQASNSVVVTDSASRPRLRPLIRKSIC